VEGKFLEEAKSWLQKIFLKSSILTQNSMLWPGFHNLRLNGEVLPLLLHFQNPHEFKTFFLIFST
jgi:hypothetical protein